LLLELFFNSIVYIIPYFVVKVKKKLKISEIFTLWGENTSNFTAQIAADFTAQLLVRYLFDL